MLGEIGDEDPDKNEARYCQISSIVQSMSHSSREKEELAVHGEAKVEIAGRCQLSAMGVHRIHVGR